MNYIELIYYNKNQPWFNRAGEGSYVGILKITDSFSNLASAGLINISDIKSAGAAGAVG